MWKKKQRKAESSPFRGFFPFLSHWLAVPRCSWGSPPPSLGILSCQPSVSLFHVVHHACPLFWVWLATTHPCLLYMLVSSPSYISLLLHTILRITPTVSGNIEVSALNSTTSCCTCLSQMTFFLAMYVLQHHDPNPHFLRELWCSKWLVIQYDYFLAAQAE